MALTVDKSLATKALNESFVRCSASPVEYCALKECADFVLNGKNCLTYRYILITALLAKSVNPEIDMLSLQAGDTSAGAYDARGLATVVYDFQKSLLGNILDGSNRDPLVNKPGRYMRLDKSNHAAKGDPEKALASICESFPLIHSSQDATNCLDYVMSALLIQKRERDAQRKTIKTAIHRLDVFKAKDFLSDLLDQGFGGASLVLAAAAAYHTIFDNKKFEIIVHPANQSGAAGRQFSDLDIRFDGKPFMGTELKDKAFTSSDVEHSAETAFKAGAASLLFIAGRQSTFASQPPSYFSEIIRKYADKGMFVGVTSIDGFLDTVFASHVNVNAAVIMEHVVRDAEKMGAVEAQMWIYKRLSEGRASG